MSEDHPIDSMNSLSPERETCLSLEDLGLLLRQLGGDPERCVTIVAMMGLLREDVQRNFPENIFYDDEILALTLLRSDNFEALFGKLRILLALFGAHSPIRFRYVHDWLYGYDWIKWVSRNPEFARAEPFCEAFVDYMLKRGEEIVASITAGDEEQYEALKGEASRNIYGFSRFPSDEVSLFKNLVKEDKLPLKAWNINSTLVADRDYFDLRLQQATELGLTFPSDGKSTEKLSIERKTKDLDGAM